jgi:hypothetical protein
MISYSATRSSVLNAHTPNEDNNDDSKDSFYQELKQVFCHFPLAPYAKSDRFQRCHIKGRRTHTEYSRIGSTLPRHLSQFCLHLMLVGLQVLFHENNYFFCFHFNGSTEKLLFYNKLVTSINKTKQNRNHAIKTNVENHTKGTNS